MTKWGTEAEATYVVGQMAIAGALTIGSPLQSFLLAMLHYPQWQARLQEEIARVCDDGRCPRWEDREKMPLLRAVVKEVIRWRPPVPTGQLIISPRSPFGCREICEVFLWNANPGHYRYPACT